MLQRILVRIQIKQGYQRGSAKNPLGCSFLSGLPFEFPAIKGEYLRNAASTLVQVVYRFE